MNRMLLSHYRCSDCKYNAKYCCYKICYDCPILTNGICLCLQDATREEISSGKCMYFEEKITSEELEK